MGEIRLIVVVVFDGVQMLDVVGPAEVFATATRLCDAGGYRLLIVSPDGRTVCSDSGVRLEVDSALADVAGAVDTLIIAGGQGAAVVSESVEIVDAVSAVGRRSRRVCSVCTGAFVLAAGGWLDGRTATTHWSVGKQLAQRFPKVAVDADRIFVRDGNIYTSGGVTSGMDLGLALLEADHDAEVARAVARHLVLFLQRPGGQSQFSERMAHDVPAKSPLRVVLDAVVADPAADHRVSNMAARAGVSERHLTRLFRQNADTTAAGFVERIRVGVARDHLEQTTVGIDIIAARSGFGSSETLRRAFTRAVGVTPSDYRQRFAGTGTPSIG